MEHLAPFIAAYSAATVVVLVGCIVGYATGDLKGNPLAYVFWPLIAAMACAVKLRKMWREE